MKSIKIGDYVYSVYGEGIVDSQVRANVFRVKMTKLLIPNSTALYLNIHINNLTKNNETNREL